MAMSWYHDTATTWHQARYRDYAGYDCCVSTGSHRQQAQPNAYAPHGRGV